MDTAQLASLLKFGPAIVSSDDSLFGLAEKSEVAARHVALNLGNRDSIIEQLQTELDGHLWSSLETMWNTLSREFGSKDLDEDSEREVKVIALALGLAKLERNLIAGIEEYQDAAIDHEESIRSLLFNITTFSRIEDPRYFQLQAVGTQLLSNLVSPINPDRLDSKVDDRLDSKVDDRLETYLSGSRTDDIISRLLDSKETKTNQATIHFINNLTRSSRQRCEMILSRPSGVSWLSRLLDKLEIFHEASDGRFELATQIFTTYINFNLHPRLFGALASANEAILPSQTSFLKVLDAHLHLGSNLDLDQNAFLIPVFHLLSAYCVLAIRSGSDDPRLPKVFEGLHLVCEILCATGLAVQARIDDAESEEPEGYSISGKAVVQEMKTEEEEQKGVIRPTTNLLRELEIFLPRTNPRLSRSATTSPLIPPDQVRPIAQLKRVLVELLGVLTFGDTGVGDQVREAGGVQMVLGMTEMDETNPYLREHALLVVRNLMLGNPANQALIGQMDPVGVLGENGELLPVPERMKRSGV